MDARWFDFISFEPSHSSRCVRGRLYSGSFVFGCLALVRHRSLYTIFMHVRFLLLARHEHRETVNVLHATEAGIQMRLQTVRWWDHGSSMTGSLP